jgi:TolB-like protein
LALMLLAGCSTMDVGNNAPALTKADRLVVLPIANYTEAPDAGQRAQSIAQSILLQKGFVNVQRYAEGDQANALVGSGAEPSISQALDWARSTGAQYALAGSVQEWRYKVGVDGEPVAGVTFNLFDLKSGAVVWSATGSRSGWSRSSLAGIGQTLISGLLAPLTIH